MHDKALDSSIEFINGWLTARFARLEIPGLVVAIAHKDRLLFSQAYGQANIESNQSMTTDHLFRIASHSKTFTATALMQLQQQGKLRIDDYASDYLPWLSQHTDVRWHQVTIRQLMSHSAGVIRDGLDHDYWNLKGAFPTTDQLQTELLDAELVYDNNTRMKYSNYGYSLLGQVIEAASDLNYHDYIDSFIIKPLGLTNTGPEFSPAMASQLVTGYSRPFPDKLRRPIINIDTRSMAPATGFYSTAADLCHYVSAHFMGNNLLLDDESKKEMQRTHWQVLDSEDDVQYGLGFEINHVNDRRMVGHGGGFPGQISQTMFDPIDQLAVVVLTNSIDASAKPIASSLIRIINWFNRSWVEHPDRDLSRFEGHFMNLWGTTDIVASGNKLVAVSFDGWWPFKNPDKLEYVDDSTLLIKRSSGFGSPGELVQFEFDQGHPTKVVYAGASLLTEADWLASLDNVKIIGQ